MSNEVETTDLQIGFPETDASASGAWSESYVKRPETFRKIGRVAQIAAVVLAIAVSPVTTVTDYWFWERQRREVSTVAYVFESVVGRRISRAEALRIARQILERAERERIQLAEWEAQRGIQWEESG